MECRWLQQRLWLQPTFPDFLKGMNWTQLDPMTKTIDADKQTETRGWQRENACKLTEKSYRDGGAHLPVARARIQGPKERAKELDEISLVKRYASLGQRTVGPVLD